MWRKTLEWDEAVMQHEFSLPRSIRPEGARELAGRTRWLAKSRAIAYYRPSTLTHRFSSRVAFRVGGAFRSRQTTWRTLARLHPYHRPRDRETKTQSPRQPLVPVSPEAHGYDEHAS